MEKDKKFDKEWRQRGLKLKKVKNAPGALALGVHFAHPISRILAVHTDQLLS